MDTIFGQVENQIKTVHKEIMIIREDLKKPVEISDRQFKNSCKIFTNKL